jgi:hypothetical protein
MLAVAVAFGWWSQSRSRLDQDRRVLAQGTSAQSAHTAVGPTWLRKFVGERIIERVFGGEFGARITHATIDNVNQLPKDPSELESLDRLQQLIISAHVTDDDCRVLTGLPRLFQLHINAANLTNASAAHLSRLQQLRYLKVDGAHFTDDGLESLTRLQRLRKLQLTPVCGTEAGVRRLATLPELRELDLYGAHVKDGCVDAFKSSPRIRRVRINRYVIKRRADGQFDFTDQMVDFE